LLTANAAGTQVTAWLEVGAQINGHPADTGPMDDSAQQAHRFGAILPLIPVPVPAPGVRLMLDGHRPQFVAGPSYAVELVVASQVDSDDINDERLVLGCRGRRRYKINRVEVVRTQAPPAPLVPLPDVLELLPQG